MTGRDSTAAPARPAEAILGLSAQEAATRLATDGPNELPTAKPRNLLQQARDVMRQPMLLLLLGAGTVNFLVAEPIDGILLMFAVLVVIGISIFQEHKTENALTALRDLSSPRALVIRDGVQVRVAGRDVVRGDHVILAEGDRVPADAVVVDCVNFSVDESALTGESVPVRKAPVPGGSPGSEVGRPGGDGTPWIFSGTLVVKGRGLAVVQHTGADTELGGIGKALRSIETESTPLQVEVDRLVRVVATMAMAAAVIVVVVYALTRGDWLEGLLAGIATAMAVIPEEFPVVLTVFLALGAWRMSQKHVLARRSAVIETLGSATVVCVDKTGTLTMNSMTVRDLVIGTEQWALDDEPLPVAFHTLAEYGVLASPVDPFDPMDKAFREIGSHYLPADRLHPTWTLIREYPLSEDLLALSHAWRAPGAEGYVVAAKGAPEAVADLCRLSPPERASLRADVDRATASGRRVLAVARARLPVDAPLPEDQREIEFEYLGLAGLQDPVRPGVAEAVAECARAGVRTVMITGDYPGTALAIAREIGLDHGAGVVTGPELEAMSDASLAEAVRSVSVYARMVPEQKLRLIRALKANDEIVGMTGDGVNDAPALRAADIGIAMGARGTDVARESAALVITDDDFTSIAGGVRQGRAIFANLRKAMAYIIAVHVPIFGMSLIPVFVADWPLVLLPLQVAFLELIIDPACSIVFEAEDVDPHIMEQPPRPVGEPMFDRRVLTVAALQGLSVLVAVLGVYLWGLSDDRPDDVVRSLAFATLVLGNIALILVNRSWTLSVAGTLRHRRNGTLKWVVGGALVTLVALLSVPATRSAFGLGVLSAADWGVVVVAAALGVAWFEGYKLLHHRPHPTG